MLIGEFTFNWQGEEILATVHANENIQARFEIKINNPSIPLYQSAVLVDKAPPVKIYTGGLENSNYIQVVYEGFHKLLCSLSDKEK